MSKTFSSAVLATFITHITHFSHADHVEEIQVIGHTSTSTIEINATNTVSADSGQVLKQIAGADINNNGPLTSIAQYRGMYGNRINVSIDGMALTSAGPNAMDAPLSYAPGSLVSSIKVYRGIAPVSVAQQAIGGAFKVETKTGSFSDSSNMRLTGELSASTATASQSQDLFTHLVLANKHHKVRAAGLIEQGDNYEFPGGNVASTEYERARGEIGYAWNNVKANDSVNDSANSGNNKVGHQFSVDFIRNETGDAGTPALPMDIAFIDTEISKARYEYVSGKVNLSAMLLVSDGEHLMTNYHLRPPMANQRENLATAQSTDAKLQAELTDAGLWRFGIDFHNAEHNATISDPNNPMFFVTNFSDITHKITGVFIETEQSIGKPHTLEAGVRVNQVQMNAGDVSTSMAMMNNMMGGFATTLRDNFNNNERDQTDNNTDIVVKFNSKVTEQFTLTSALGQKTRSATYQERYLWLPMQATGGLADGHNYIGTPDLAPETSAEIELGFDWLSENIYFSPRIFQRKVNDYIQGTPVQNNMPVIMISTMMGGDDRPLQFNNVDATLQGLDLQWQVDITEKWALSGTGSMIRGERNDIDDKLYRISPDNLSIAATFRSKQNESSVQVVSYARQDQVSTTNDEAETAGYSILNAHTAFNLKPVRILLGIENLMDKNYEVHTGGYNRVMMSDVNIGARLPGVGRNIYAKLQWRF